MFFFFYSTSNHSSVSVISSVIFQYQEKYEEKVWMPVDKASVHDTKDKTLSV